MPLTKINADVLDSLSPPLSIGSGGTGLSTITANSLLLGNGTSALQLVAPGTSGNVLTSNGTTWTSSPLGVIGVGQTWQTPSRAAGTTYTNNTGKPIQVLICVNPSTAPNILVVTVGGVQIYATGSNTWDNSAQAAFIVPDGTSYSITTSSSVRTWAELR